MPGGIIFLGNTGARMPSSQSQFMMYLSDYVSKGHDQYMSGFVPADRAESFAKKIDQKFQTDAKASKRATRKRNGMPNFVLIIHPISDDKYFWIVLAAGKSNAIEKMADKHSEVFKSALNKEERIGFKGYELKRVTKSAKAGGGKKWTWFLDRKTAKELQEELITNARKGSLHQLEMTVGRTRRRPLFSGVRQQVSDMFLKTNWELKRRRKNSATYVKPEFLAQELPFFGNKIPIFTQR